MNIGKKATEAAPETGNKNNNKSLEKTNKKGQMSS